MSIFTPASNDGTLNGTTPVTLVASPAASIQRIVKALTIQNRDTAAVTVTVRFVNGANTRQICVITLAVNDQIIFGEEDYLVLDATNKSITAVMSGAPATTNPDFVAHYADYAT
jgi:hypothetical protein